MTLVHNLETRILTYLKNLKESSDGIGHFSFLKVFYYKLIKIYYYIQNRKNVFKTNNNDFFGQNLSQFKLVIKKSDEGY